MKKRFNTLVLTLVACYCLSILPMIFTSCANSSSGNGSGNENNSTASVSSVIGAAGGQVGNENASITIPAGALDSDTTITVKYLPKEEELTEAPMLGFAGAVEFGPSGTKFNSPAEVMVKLTQTPKNTALSIFCYDEENDRWQFESDAEIKNGYAKFEVNHFSKYRIVDITPGLLQKYFDIIKSNFENKIPDTVSREQYKDYLINTVKVLDSYEIWGGRLYKACGFLISANYYIDGVEDDPNDLIDLVGKDTERVKTGDLLYCKSKAKVSNSGSTESQIIMHTLLAIYYEPVPTYHLEGHISEEVEYKIDVYPADTREGFEIVKPEEIKIIVDYDFEGLITEDEGKINGCLDYKKFKTKYENKEGETIYQPTGVQIMKTVISTSFSVSNSSAFSSTITGSCENSNCQIKHSGGERTIVSLNGITKMQHTSLHQAFDSAEDEASTDVSIITGGNTAALLDFNLLDANKTSTVTSFKDSLNLNREGLLVIQNTDNISNSIPFECTLTNTKTTQTIKITAIPDEI